jgi:hypothetical protein
MRIGHLVKTNPIKPNFKAPAAPERSRNPIKKAPAAPERSKPNLSGDDFDIFGLQFFQAGQLVSAELSVDKNGAVEILLF